MRVVRALFDGQKVKPIDPIMTKKETEILLIFPDDPKNTAKAATSKEARMLLRGSGKGENLTEKLLRSRVEDFDFEKG